MCQEIYVKKTAQTITTSRELANFLGIECEKELFCHGFDEESLKELEERKFDWRDTCLCGVNIEFICQEAGKKVEWDRDPSVLIIEE